MRILLAHNYYRSGSPGGEDIVFEQERDLLLAAGHDVHSYTRSNDEVDENRFADQLRVLSGMQRSARTIRELRGVIRRFRPQVVHFHNVFPLISVSAYDVCRAEGVPVVQTVHNFRLSCSAAIHFRDGHICELCTPDNPWPAVRYRCFRGSRAGSLAVASTLFRNNASRVHQRQITRFIALTNFSARRLTLAGIPAERIVIKPNFISDHFKRNDGEPRGKGFVFAGRLSHEKGVKFLLETWAGLGDIPLTIAGDGPLKNQLQSSARQMGLPVKFAGVVGREDLARVFRSARAVVVPSLCFEGGIPLSLLEAMATGTPVIASRIGGIPELITHESDGLLFDPSDSVGLIAAVRRMHFDDSLWGRISSSCSAKVYRDHAAEPNLRALISVYDSVLGV